MSGLAALLNNINSGAVDVNTNDAAAAAKAKPKTKPKDSNLRAALLGKAGAVNTTAGAVPASKSTRAPRATPPPGAAAARAQKAAEAANAAAASHAAGAAALRAPSPPSVDAGTVPQRLKKVLDLLQVQRDVFTFSSLKASVGVDLEEDYELLKELSKHEQVSYDAHHQKLWYKPKLSGIYNKEDLKRYIERETTLAGRGKDMHGIKLSDVNHAYVGVPEDVKQLQLDGVIHMYPGTAGVKGEAALFAVDMMKLAPVDQEVVDLFLATELPKDAQGLQEACKAAGLRSLLASRPARKRDADEGGKKGPRKKKHKKINLQKATNAHLPELFMGEQPDQIDTR